MLVSIVVLSVGVLGLVGLQAGSIQATREARLQASAVALARELAEMVRGNRTAGVMPLNTNPYVVKTTASSMAAPVPSNCLSAGNSCANATAIANAEMTEWLQRVDTELPAARVSVCFDSAPYDSGGLPQWNCSDSGSTLVVKIGWTRAAYRRGNAEQPLRAFASDARPAVVLPLLAGTSL